jgi:eukaryotic-like serine/threonine-protein kinase
MPLSTGQILNNRYRIVRLLGQGGFGAVYRAWDMNLNIVCALKENLDTSPEAQRQFAREASLLATLRHPHLPVVGDHFSLAGQGQYLVMDYVEGEDLQAMLDRTGGPLPLAQVLPWIIQVCDALTYLHTHLPPVIHRDIKPANIKITPQSQAVLVDFGVAKVYDPNLKTTLGARAVTPGYSPPEQYGRGTTDARSDIYALGATFYTLLTGDTPPDSVDIMTRRASMPAPASSLNLQISPQVSAAIEKAMQPDWSQRYTSAAEFALALATPTPPEQIAPAPGQPVLTTQAQPGMPRTSAVIRPQSSPAVPKLQAAAPAQAQPAIRKTPSAPQAPVSAQAATHNQGWLLWGGATVGLILLVVAILVVGNLNRKQPENPALSQVRFPVNNILYFSSDQTGKREIYYYSDREARSIRLTNTPGDSESWEPAVAPDGTLYFTSNQTGKREIYYFSDQQGRSIQLTNTTGDWECWEPAIAPDGTLYFNSNQSGKDEIYYYSDQQAKSLRLTNTPGDGKSWEPAIAPDGTLYFTSNQSGKDEIYYYSDQQAKSLRLTNTPGDGKSWEPEIAPDGTLYFTSNQSGKDEIYYYSDPQAQSVRLTNTPGNFKSWEPAVAPDGTLYFTSNQSGKEEIFYYSDQQAESVQLTNTPGSGGSREPAF